MPKGLIFIWLAAALIIYFIGAENGTSKVIVPLICVSVLVYALRCVRVKYIEYLLFFTISIASLFGLTKTLTGSHAESSNIFLYGLSFYTASLAYLVANRTLDASKIWSVSNPLLTSTGPIALFFKAIHHKKTIERIKYYIPFVIIGIFMFQVVGSPLANFFFLLEKTDVVSSLLFAAIFEMFVYMNFCGLSLVIYGLFGVFGYRVPLNFRQPFSSNNLVDFWRGWHTSLSAVLKILFYKPLRKKYPLIIALLGVYIASAMWHGVTLNFFIWGSFHALTFWATIQLLKRRLFIISFALLPLAIVIGRLIFADSNSERLIEKLSFNFTNFDGLSLILGVSIHSLVSLLLGALMIFSEYAFRNTKVMKKRNYKYLRSPLMLLAIISVGLFFASNAGVDYAVYGQR